MRRPVWFAIGNPLCGDDGVAWRVVQLLGLADRALRVHQLTPELAAELEDATEAVFIDADAAADAVILEPVAGAPAVVPSTHHLEPAAVVALARRLYNFTGPALICRIPAPDLSICEELSEQGEMHSRIASHMLKLKGEELLECAG